MRRDAKGLGIVRWMGPGTKGESGSAAEVDDDDPDDDDDDAGIRCKLCRSADPPTLAFLSFLSRPFPPLASRA